LPAKRKAVDVKLEKINKRITILRKRVVI
jgi:hypothetical protein